ncbi:helix-turn-helix transcriptional regulator [Agromyces sp. NPDC058064]|uniref:PadR family transcriptional regulator n=1 Tax=Agromyces sp. NPDC058064 TaxID=3346322 RepID=UPI0036DBA37F
MTPPVFAHGSLRLYLLALLEERPRHGYELIQALSDRFGGTYSPSAGTIYPRLSKLEEEGLVTKSSDGRKTVYEITDAGRTELDARRHELDAIEDEVTDSVRRLAEGVRAEVNDAMRTLRAELASAAREAKRSAGSATAAEAGGRAGSDAGSGSSTRVGDGDDSRAGVDARVESTRAVHEADLVLNEFRQRLRTELRTQAHQGLVPPETVTLLRARLAQVHADVLATLTRP